MDTLKTPPLDFTQLGFVADGSAAFILRPDKKKPQKKVFARSNLTTGTMIIDFSDSWNLDHRPHYCGKISSIEFARQLLINLGVKASALAPDNRA